ncbi:ThiF family adenylyltransferase [Microbacterium aureliae]
MTHGDTALSSEEVARYARQLVLPELGYEGQRRLKQARVAVVGAGGLGSPVVSYLAAAGVGRLRLIDDDVVEMSNLGRQVIHGTHEVGAPKVESAARAVAAANPLVTVEPRRVRLVPANATALLEGADVVVDGSDEFATRYTVADAAEELGIPVVWGAVLRFAGHVSVFSSRDGFRYRDVFPEPPSDDDAPPCELAGVLGAVCAMVGSVMAMETLKLLTGIGQSLCGRLQVIDALTGSVRTVTLARAGRVPPAVGAAVPRAAEAAGTDRSRSAVPTVSARQLQGLLSSTSPPVLLDVRESTELAAGDLPGSVHMPLAELISEGPPAGVRLDRAIVVYCASGVRSAQATAHLQRLGVAGVASLEGGFRAWSALVRG